MSSSDLLKNITSKDINLSKKTILNLIESRNNKDFEELCEKSEFIFPFLKERITNDFVKLINEKNLDAVFDFAKIYCADFEDLIVKSWLKFADEDLTDRILEIFENGSNDEKAYAARYFFFIKDSLALEFLKENAKSDFSPLKINCAKTLFEFNDFSVLDEMIQKVEKSEDEFEKAAAFEFILATGGIKALKFTISYCFESPFVSDIISNLLDFNEFSDLKNIFTEDEIARIFSILIENYPENIPLNTIIYYCVSDFIKFLKNSKNSYAKNLLALAKKNFEEYLADEIYSFDLDKNLKAELKNIVEILSDCAPSFSDLEHGLEYREAYRIEAALKVISEYKISEFAPAVAKFVNDEKIPLSLRALCASVLKSLKKTDLIDENSIEKIEDENIKALIRSYL